jgi:lipopolysaccharide assembly protein A
MRYLIWLLRAVLFLVLLGFAIKNDQPIVLRYFFGYEWQASLVLVLLLFFAVGVGIGMFALLGNILRQRKEIAGLKRELRLKNKLAAAGDETRQYPVQPS